MLLPALLLASASCVPNSASRPAFSQPSAAASHEAASPRLAYGLGSILLADLDVLQLRSASASPASRIGARQLASAERCLAQAVYYEAGAESEEGQRAVAQVVLNRVGRAGYPKTVCGVVYQPASAKAGCQFSFTCDGSMDRRADRGGWQQASRYAHEALAGYVFAPVGQSTHYHASYVTPRWARTYRRITRIGAHIFYS